MSDQKNLKVAEDIHRQLSDRAKRMGMKIGVLAETLIAFGLKQSDRRILDERSEAPESEPRKR